MLRFLLLSCLSLLALSAQAQVQILTSIKPLQLIAAAIQDGQGEPQVLLPPGASPHYFVLRPSDAKRLDNADLFYWIGPDLENFLPRLLKQRSQPSVAAQDLPDLHLQYFAEAHAHDHDHGHALIEHDHAHQPGTVDAHLWLDPHNAELIAQRISADLSALDPENAAHYAANLQAFSQALQEVDGQLKVELAPLKNQPFFVFHEAFNYFEQAYGLAHTGVFAVSSEVQPGAKHVQQMRTRLQQAGAACVFSEPPLQPRLAQTLAAGLPVKLAELDPLGVDIPVSAQGYTQLLRNLGAQFSACLSTL
ncbi:zinc ABC transporter substrate-binding protein ZnuA [Denitrificimonas caeni]|uniref:High-affinity zinc uptake system protein ZnuA n=1 Tax=Denitrificimonas caeni TaxID=521720 RepID=A0AAF0ALJ0_9GAMM|nr:zinc ABC transporter substrate-binding protein ZnuA [Denitrificimonas caeni]WBE25693.1 zinc ABC transporter substrate-binding protein ZnuA [Denitrificimonas caeni]